MTKINNREADRLRTVWHREIGQSMAELAFLLPIFFTLVFGIIEFSRAWAAKHALTLAAREGARILVLPYGAGLPYSAEGQVKAAAEEAVRAYLNSSGVPVTNSTRIIPVKVLPGGDSVFGTEDDVYEPNYTNAVRGDRVGFVIRHNFDTPLGTLLAMFARDHAHESGESAEIDPNGIKMGATSFMVHE